MTEILFAAFARTPRGRELLADDLRATLPATFPAAARSFWVCRDAGVALHAPAFAEDAARRDASALALVGTRYGQNGQNGQNGRDGQDGRDGPRSQRQSWPPERAAASSGREARASAVFAAFLDDPGAAIASWRGEAAVVCWDGVRQRLSMARDPLGQRGLFLRDDDDVTWVCSELAPLLTDPAFACRLDLESAYHYLQNGRPPWGRTIAEGISRIPAAHLAQWRPGTPVLRHRVFTALRDDAQKVADEPLRAVIRDRLDDAIAARLSDGRQALLLSGGVDSSYLAARGAALLGTRQLETYTIEFAAPFPHNETQFARLVASRFGLRHHVVPLDLPATRPLLEQVLAAEEPCAAWATVTHHHLVTHIRGDGHRALVSGLGSDEVFGGYWPFLEVYLRWRRHQKRWARPDDLDAFDSALWTRGADAAYLFASNARFFDEKSLSRVVHPPFSRWRDTSLLEEFYREQRRIKHGAHWFEMAVAHECEHRIPDLLFANFEPIARAASLRCSYPFLDLPLLPLVCGLGPSSRFEQASARSWRNKVALREIAADVLPAEIMQRPLTSYTAPIALWMTSPAIARPLLARLRRSKFWKLGLVRRTYLPSLEAAVQRALAGDKRGGPALLLCQRLWALITLTAWYDRYVEAQR